MAPARGSASVVPLVQAGEMLRAIREGEIDALVVRAVPPGAELFTLSSADRPYRIFVENMRDGAVTVSPSGIVVYADRHQSLAAIALATLTARSRRRPTAGLAGAGVHPLAPGPAPAERFAIALSLKYQHVSPIAGI
jgi:hypothetical protein